VFDGCNGGLIGHTALRGPIPLSNIRAVFEAWRDFGTNTAGT
jgi:hypothetical protein